jgi:hypothetical protein
MLNGLPSPACSLLSVIHLASQVSVPCSRVSSSSNARELKEANQTKQRCGLVINPVQAFRGCRLPHLLASVGRLQRMLQRPQFLDNTKHIRPGDLGESFFYHLGPSGVADKIMPKGVCRIPFRTRQAYVASIQARTISRLQRQFLGLSITLAS